MLIGDSKSPKCTVAHRLQIAQNRPFYSRAAREIGQTVSEPVCQVLHSICHAVVRGRFVFAYEIIMSTGRGGSEMQNKIPSLGSLIA